MQFRTHKDDVVTGQALIRAQHAVADWYRDNAYGIRAEELYASHVTEATKEKRLQEQLAQAERIRSGVEPMGFWLWQRLNTELTGECIAFLPA